MKVIEITNKEQVENLMGQNPDRVLIFFKHSTRCSISRMAWDRLNRNATVFPDDLELYYVDVLNSREVSNFIAQISGVQHESPQVIILKNSSCVFTASHNEIDAAEISSKI